MRVENHKDFACFEYVSETSNRYKLGDIVFKKQDKEIGVIIQIHNDDEFRTDMFGNCDYSEIKLATQKQIEKFRPELMSVKKIIFKEIAFRIDGSESSNIDTIKLTFEKTDIDNIKKLTQICKENECIFSIKMFFDNFAFIDEDEKDITSEWRADVSQIIVYKDSFYFYAQNKWDAADQIESSEISLVELDC